MTIQPQNNNLNYLIDPTFTNVNRLFVLSFSRNNNTDKRDSFSDYYVPNVKSKDFNVLINGKIYQKIIEMSNNDDYTSNLLDFAYFKENYELIAIDLSKQTKLKDPQQIKIKIKIMEQQCSLLLKNQKKLLLIFYKIPP